jgi:hypothetical protein
MSESRIEFPVYSQFVIYREAVADVARLLSVFTTQPGAHLPPGTRVRPGEPWKGVIQFDDGSVLSEEETHSWTCQELYDRGVHKVIIRVPLDVIDDACPMTDTSTQHAYTGRQL